MGRTLAAFVLLAALAAPAFAEEAWSPDVWHDVMSPYCPGRTLADCPSPQAQDLRAWIADQEAQGRSRVEVEEQLYRLYGDMILSAPRAEGWGLAAYLVPVGAFVLGGLVLVVFLRRQGGAVTAEPGGVVPAEDPELERIIDDELGNPVP